MKVCESRPLQQHWLHGHAQHAKSSYIFYSSSENISLFNGFGGSLWEKLQIQHQILKFCLCVLGIFQRRNYWGGQGFSCTSGFHVKPSSNCPTTMRAELRVWKPISATVSTVWHISVSCHLTLKTVGQSRSENFSDSVLMFTDTS